MDRMDHIASWLTAEEIEPALEFVALLQRSGQLTQEDAIEWTMRIQAWARYKVMPATDPPRA